MSDQFPFLPIHGRRPKMNVETEDTNKEEKMEVREGSESDNNSPASIPADADVDMEAEENSRAEGLLRFEVHNCSKIKDTVFSKPVKIRNLPWRIMFTLRFSNPPERTKSIGIFVQCNADSPTTTWSCQANLEITMINHENPSHNQTRRTKHIFHAKENDWGYSCFMQLSEALDPSKGFCKNDSIILEALVVADAPHGVFWDSKKLTGYVGLKNQGATCYMNSLLQTLFFTNQLRKAVYMMPTESDDPNKSVALALQRVFYDLQHGNKAVGTKKLTRSFGWETLDSFMQHDVQELCRVLLDNMECKMKGTVVEGTIPKLLEGKMTSYIKCVNVDYCSNRVEPFYDIQLNVKNKKNVIDSFREYVAVENMDGDNKYDAGPHGLQEAKKGVIFNKLPPVLHLHLLRFQYDFSIDTNYKINDRYEFYEKLDLKEFLEAQESTPATYVLHAVLVHSGDNHGGHYVVYINPKGDGKWIKFDDDVVSLVTKKEAIQNNFGGNDDDVMSRQCTNAYMLVYIRESHLDEVLKEVASGDIPPHLEQKIQYEKRLEEQRKKEKAVSHLYMDFGVVTEELFFSHNGMDLFDPDNTRPMYFHVLKSFSVVQLHEYIAQVMGYPEDLIRLWRLHPRGESIYRPTCLEYDCKEIRLLVEGENRLMLYVETTRPDLSMVPLSKFNMDVEVLLFFKYYDPKSKVVSYRGHLRVDIRTPWESLYPELRKMARLPADTPLVISSEIGPLCLSSVDVTQKISQSVNDLLDGDIFIYQIDPSMADPCEFPDVTSFYNDLFQQIDVVLSDKNIPTDPGFVVRMSNKMTYHQMAAAVAAHIEIEPNKIQFFKSLQYKDGVGTAIKCTFDGTVKDLFPLLARRNIRRLYYNLLSIPIEELENKMQFKCSWVNSKLKDERELSLFVDKDSTVRDLLVEATRVIDQSDRTTMALRLTEMANGKVTAVLSEDLPCEVLQNHTNKLYRVEEVLPEELNTKPGDILIPVGHFQKDIYSVFGVPFMLKVNKLDTYDTVKTKVQTRLELSDREVEKIKFCLVNMGKATPFPDDLLQAFPVALFNNGIVVTSTVPFPVANRPFVGLDHVNKASKRTRQNYLEKPIKIHN